jgi:hypothetical protein
VLLIEFVGGCDELIFDIEYPDAALVNNGQRRRVISYWLAAVVTTTSIAMTPAHVSHQIGIPISQVDRRRTSSKEIGGWPRSGRAEPQPHCKPPQLMQQKVT